MNDREDAQRTRPLWRRIFEFPLVALVVGIIAVLAPAGIFAIAVQKLSSNSSATSVATSLVLIVATLISAGMYKLVVTRLGEGPRDDLTFDNRAVGFAQGTVIAAILMTLIVACVALLGSYSISGWGGSTSFAVLLFGAGLQAAFVEEIVVRGIIFRFLEEFGGSWFALAFSSALFGIAHYGNPNATVFSSLAIAFEAGIMLGGAYMLTRNLWLAIGIHFGWNVTQGYIWDIPVSGGAVDELVESHTSGSELISGGAFGLEASIVALVLATVFGVYLVYRAVRKGNLVRPWWVRRRMSREQVVDA